MPENQVRAMRAMTGMSQAELAKRLPDNANDVIVGFIEGGRVLPTQSTMQVLCDMFKCKPTDLYPESELVLTNANPQPRPAPRNVKQTTIRPKRGAGHDGMTEFRAWMNPQEKAALERSIKKLGYRNGAEWFREAYRETLERCIKLGIPEDGEIVTVITKNN